MKTFFSPASIAVIGASPREGSLGYQIITNLRYGYTGRIYPVNPNYPDIQNLPCYPTVEAIPGPVELAIVIVPAPAVPEALAACGRKGILRVIIESAGFAETGEEGRAAAGALSGRRPRCGHPHLGAQLHGSGGHSEKILFHVHAPQYLQRRFD